MEMVFLYAFKLQSNKVHSTLLIVLLHFEDFFFVGQCTTTNNDFLFPFMFAFFGFLSLGDCLLKSNLGIFQANFLHAYIKLNFIGSILTCF